MTQLQLIPAAPTARQLKERSTTPFAVGQDVAYTRCTAAGRVERIQRDTYTGDWWVWFTPENGPGRWWLAALCEAA